MICICGVEVWCFWDLIGLNGIILKRIIKNKLITSWQVMLLVFHFAISAKIRRNSLIKFDIDNRAKRESYKLPVISTSILTLMITTHSDQVLPRLSCRAHGIHPSLSTGICRRQSEYSTGHWTQRYWICRGPLADLSVGLYSSQSSINWIPWN